MLGTGPESRILMDQDPLDFILSVLFVSRFSVDYLCMTTRLYRSNVSKNMPKAQKETDISMQGDPQRCHGQTGSPYCKGGL